MMTEGHVQCRPTPAYGDSHMVCGLVERARSDVWFDRACWLSLSMSIDAHSINARWCLSPHPFTRLQTCLVDASESHW